MPHIIIEHTSNLADLPFEKVLSAVTQKLAQSPEVLDEADLKGRIVELEKYRVGLEDSHRAFIHITLRILEGRSDEVKKQLSELILQGALSIVRAAPLGIAAHLSVEVVDMHRVSYSKIKLAQ